MKINFYKSLLPYLPWLTFIFGGFHLIGDLGRQSGFGQLWNVGLFIAGMLVYSQHFYLNNFVIANYSKGKLKLRY